MNHMRMLLHNTILHAESWNVAWRKAAPGAILTDQTTPFTIIENPLRYWAADPFVVEREGKTYIFAELYDYIRCRGILGVCELIPGQKCRWEPIIIEPFHLSYPCVLEHGGKTYLMPESQEDRSLLLYEAVEFPRKWKQVKKLRADVSFADTTPVSDDGLALTHQVADSRHPQLLLIDLTGSRPDVPAENQELLRSRPAGKPFRLDGRLIRPIQHSWDFDRNYGKSLIFSAVTMEGTLCREESITEITPQDLQYSRPIFLDGMHTYNASTHFEVIDIKTLRFNLLNLLFRVLRKVTHLLWKAGNL